VGRPQRIPTPLHTPSRHGLASTVDLSRLLLNLRRALSQPWSFHRTATHCLLFCACATVQLRNASRARQELKMAIFNAAFYLNHSRVFGWQILKSVVPTDAYSTIFHNAVLPSVVDVLPACPHQSKFIAGQKHTILLEWPNQPSYPRLFGGPIRYVAVPTNHERCSTALRDI